MISNSLDIDFIHSDIHGRSYKKSEFKSTTVCSYLNDPTCQPISQVRKFCLIKLLLVIHAPDIIRVLLGRTPDGKPDITVQDCRAGGAIFLDFEGGWR